VCTEAVSSSKRALTNESLVRAQHLPAYESFCLLIYLSLTAAFYESLIEMLAKPLKKKAPKPKDDAVQDRDRELREWAKDLTKLSTLVLEAEVNYLIGSAPLEAGKELYAALLHWTITLLSRDGYEDAFLSQLKQKLSEVCS
jgi:hypothetical protein